MAITKTEFKSTLAIVTLVGTFGLIGCSSSDDAPAATTGDEAAASSCIESSRTALAVGDASEIGLSGQDLIDWLQTGLTGTISFENSTTASYILTGTSTSIDYVEYTGAENGTENIILPFAICDPALEVGLDMTLVSGDLFNESFSTTLFATDSTSAKFDHVLTDVVGTYAADQYVDTTGQTNVTSTLSVTVSSGVWDGTINAAGEIYSGTDVVSLQIQLVGTLAP